MSPRPSCASLLYRTPREFTLRTSELRRFSASALRAEADVTVRVMLDDSRRPWLVAKDLCALIGKRMGSVGRATHAFTRTEKARMAVQQRRSGSDGDSRTFVQVLSVLSVAGVRRLLSRSRSDRAQPLLSTLLRDIERLIPLRRNGDHRRTRRARSSHERPALAEAQEQAVCAANGNDVAAIDSDGSNRCDPSAAAALNQSGCGEPASPTSSSEVQRWTGPSARSAFITPRCSSCTSSTGDRVVDSQRIALPIR